MINLDELEKLEKEATPGPWKYDYGNWEIEKERTRESVCYFLSDLGDIKKRLAPEHFDAELITAMRNALPELLRRAREWEKVFVPWDEKDIYLCSECNVKGLWPADSGVLCPICNRFLVRPEGM